jgi:Zn-finger nucleic acid-binding protein
MSDYRHGMLRCPECGDTLAEEALVGAHIDRCAACGGVWVDWMDGDLATVSAEVASLGRRGRAAAGPAAGDAASRSCPRCHGALDAMHERGLGGLFFRCGSCVGAFVPRGSLEALVAHEGSAPASTDPLLTRILDALGRILLLSR